MQKEIACNHIKQSLKYLNVSEKEIIFKILELLISKNGMRRNALLAELDIIFSNFTDKFSELLTILVQTRVIEVSRTGKYTFLGLSELGIQYFSILQEA